MTNLYDLLRLTIAAGVDTASKEAADELEYAASAILDAIRHETRHVRAELDEASRIVQAVGRNAADHFAHALGLDDGEDES